VAGPAHVPSTTADPRQQPPMDRPAPPKAPAPPNALAPPNTDQVNEALRALRERYRASVANTVAGFRYLAAQLTVGPDKADVLEALRRELHRVHGTAGSFGFPDASRLAGVLEARAVRWAADPTFDRGTRGAIIAHFASALEAHVCGTPAPPAPPHAQSHLPATAPGRPSPAKSAGGGQGAAGGETASAAVGPHVILVEDDPSLTEMLRYALEATGHTYQHYGTGPEALAALLALKTGPRRPVVLLDVDLPGLDGFSLYERLRAARPDAFVVVFLTAHAAEAEQLRAYRAGVIDYVTKPVNMRILMAKLPSWLERGGTRTT
jgi:CheY-like chemotaxis protein/HPt (histidine-containing phosphotransfer) domain-containing protein